MKEKEKIKVFVRIENGHTVCLCARANKKCSRHCEMDVVERDRFQGWQKGFTQDRYGRND